MPSCGTERIRDHNAAVNLKHEVMKILVASQKSTSVESRSESVESLVAFALTT
jgi:hypothetical protein